MPADFVLFFNRLQCFVLYRNILPGFILPKNCGQWKGDSVVVCTQTLYGVTAVPDQGLWVRVPKEMDLLILHSIRDFYLQLKPMRGPSEIVHKGSYIDKHLLSI